MIRAGVVADAVAAAVAAAAAVLTSLPAGRAFAQGGHIGEGGGWDCFFLLVLVGADLLLGIMATAALLILRRRRPAGRGLAWPILGCYLVPLAGVPAGAFAALFTSALPVLVALPLLIQAGYVWLVLWRWRRRSRSNARK